MVRSITSAPASFSRVWACEGEISWSTRMTSAPASTSACSSLRLPTPKYPAESKPARFWVKVWTTSNPSVLASGRSSVSEASSSWALTLGLCTAATTARRGFWVVSLVIDHAAYRFLACRALKATATAPPGGCFALREPGFAHGFTYGDAVFAEVPVATGRLRPQVLGMIAPRRELVLGFELDDRHALAVGGGVLAV